MLKHVAFADANRRTYHPAVNSPPKEDLAHRTWWTMMAS